MSDLDLARSMFVELLSQSERNIGYVDDLFGDMDTVVLDGDFSLVALAGVVKGLLDGD